MLQIRPYSFGRIRLATMCFTAHPHEATKQFLDMRFLVDLGLTCAGDYMHTRDELYKMAHDAYSTLLQWEVRH